jgi:hypothetical protein
MTLINTLLILEDTITKSSEYMERETNISTWKELANSWFNGKIVQFSFRWNQ